jgi:hypothetical protein
LTFVADGTCALSEDMRTRTYTATIAEAVHPNNPPGTIFYARLTGATFVAGYDQILIGVTPDFVTLTFGDHGPGIVEQVAANT